MTTNFMKGGRNFISTMCTAGPLFCSVFLGVLLLLSSQLQVSGRPEELFIKPTLSEDCGNKQPCLTLSDYIQDVDFYFTSHKTFYFLPGNHTVQSHEATSVVIQNVMNLTLTAKQQASVVCEGKLSFSFINISNLNLSNLEFVGCGLEKDDSNEVQAAIKLDKISTVLLRHLNIRESFGYGIIGFNVIGKSKVMGCRFTTTDGDHLPMKVKLIIKPMAEVKPKCWVEMHCSSLTKNLERV